MEKLKNLPNNILTYDFNKESFAQNVCILKQYQQEESDFPFLKHDVNFFRLLSDIQRQVSIFKDDLSNVPIKSAISSWFYELRNLNEITRKKYIYCMESFIDQKLIHEYYSDGKNFNLGGFKYVQHSDVIRYIKKYEYISKNGIKIDKADRINCYIRFIEYLNRISYGWFERSLHDANKEYRLSIKALEEHLKFTDWRAFIDVLSDINHRDSIIARCLVQGSNRISDILNLKLEQLDFTNNIIIFESKNPNNKYRSISYTIKFMNELKQYVDTTFNERKTSSYVFITRTGKRLIRSRLNFSFEKASLQAKIKKVTPEILRSILIIFKEQGYNEEAIMRSKKWGTND